jgi:uncharacterized protein (DUF1800 family)
MVLYLDLGENRREAPNENFARELFELFLLGEGSYTEADVKEAARAFTGYRIVPSGGVAFVPKRHDPGVKTVFGRTGPFAGDDVIDLAYTQPAAAAHLPRRMALFYLADQPLPAAHLAALGSRWREAGYDLRWLARRFFGSRMFFDPSFRGAFIKSPVQYYLALLQDLGLDPMPVPRAVVNPLRRMGQVPFSPPNVRGWTGGRTWINSGSLAARRAVVESLFFPLNEANLNADEWLEIAAARTTGRDRFTVPESRIARLASLEPEAAVSQLEGELLALPAGPGFRSTLGGFIAAAGPNPRERFRRTRRALIALLESPEYQLC